MPLLLPAIAFVISVFIILQMGILPIQEYKGENLKKADFINNTNLDFNVYNSNVAYSKETILAVHSDLEPGQSIEIVLNFTLGGALIDTASLQLIAGENESEISNQMTLSLEPGRYAISIEATHYDGSSVSESNTIVHLTLTQPILHSIIQELVRWSTFQFTINVGCFFFILGACCIGKEDVGKTRVDEYNKKESTSGEYRTYDS